MSSPGLGTRHSDSPTCLQAQLPSVRRSQCGSEKRGLFTNQKALSVEKQCSCQLLAEALTERDGNGFSSLNEQSRPAMALSETWERGAKRRGNGGLTRLSMSAPHVR